MSLVFTAAVTVAGPATSLGQFHARCEQDGASLPQQDLCRTVLCADGEGRPLVIEYLARTSRQRPVVWEVARSSAMQDLGLLTLGVLFEEQGDGAVFLEHGAKALLANPSLYGYDDEDLQEVRKAEQLFARTARALFGVDVAAAVAQRVETGC